MEFFDKSMFFFCCGVFCFFVFVSVSEGVVVPGVTDEYVCDYYLADSEGLTMNKVVDQLGILWSLHGVWNFKNVSQKADCVSYDYFLSDMHREFEAGRLTHFVDASPMTQHTCCRGQWHEYRKHACMFGVSYEFWKKAVFSCINSFLADNHFVHRCRFDDEYNCNAVEEVSSLPIGMFDCRHGVEFCKEELKNSPFHTPRRFWNTRHFYMGIEVNEILNDENFNCFCTPYRSKFVSNNFLIINSFVNESVYPSFDPKNNKYSTTHATTTDVAITTRAWEFLPTKPIVSKPTTEKPQSDEKKCTCVTPADDPFFDLNDDESWLESFTIHSTKEIEALLTYSGDYSIFCKRRGGSFKRVKKDMHNIRMSVMDAAVMEDIGNKLKKASEKNSVLFNNRRFAAVPKKNVT